MQQLLNIMQKLRQECPWDKAQTPESLTKYAIEEAYEVEAAVRESDPMHVKEELGDLLLQVVFQSHMYSEQGYFTFQDVVDGICQKLIRRHPHVFDQENFAALNETEVAELWQKIKQQEKQGQAKHRLDQVKPGPALKQAEDIQKNVAKIGFDFPHVQEAYGKLEEELAEFKEALELNSAKDIEEEFGDCLFSLVNIGRKLNISSEIALLGTVHKFRSRFAYIEDQAAQQSKTVDEMSLHEMDQLWEQAKQHFKQQE